MTTHQRSSRPIKTTNDSRLLIDLDFELTDYSSIDTVGVLSVNHQGQFRNGKMFFDTTFSATSQIFQQSVESPARLDHEDPESGGVYFYANSSAPGFTFVSTSDLDSDELKQIEWSLANSLSSGKTITLFLEVDQAVFENVRVFRTGDPKIFQSDYLGDHEKAFFLDHADELKLEKRDQNATPPWDSFTVTGNLYPDSPKYIVEGMQIAGISSFNVSFEDPSAFESESKSESGSESGGSIYSVVISTKAQKRYRINGVEGLQRSSTIRSPLSQQSKEP